MGLFASSILVKYSLLNNSGSLVYAGTSSNSLRIWGAQLELAEYSEDILNDYINNYRYVRTTGQAQNFYGIRFGSGVNGDQSVDSVLIGGSSGTRMNNVVAESTNFFIDKSPLRGVDLGTQTTVSSAAVFTSSYTTVSSTNLLVSSEDFTNGNWVTYGTVAVSSNAVLSPVGTYDADRITFGGNASGIYQNIIGKGLTDYVLSVWLRSDTPVTMGIASDTNFGQAQNTSITTTSSWTRYTFSRSRTLVDTNIVNMQLINYPNYATPNTGVIYAWGAQLITSTATIAALGYPYYVRTTSSAIFNAPISSTMNLIDSGDFLNTGLWTDVNGSLTRSSAVGVPVSPDGTQTAYLLTDTSFSGDGAATERNVTISASATNVYTLSLYVKQFDIFTAYVDLYVFFTGSSTRGSFIRYNFGPQTVVATSAEGPGITPFNAGVQQVGNGWARIYFSVYDLAGTNTNLQFRFYPSSRDAVRGACYAYGPQLSLYSPSTVLGPAGLTDFIKSTGTAISYFATTSVSASITSAGFTLTTTTSFTLTQTFSGTATITGADHDRLFVGQQYRPDTRLSGDPQEQLNFDLRKRIKDTPGVDGTGVTVSDDRRRIPSNPVYDAAKVAGLELLKKTNQTFSYNRFTPVAGDNVYYNANDWFSEVGRSQRARMAIGGDTQVHFFDKRLDEVKQIPQNPRFDALRVMGIEPVYKTSSIITLSKYTPVHNSDYTYYKRYDWFSEVPRSQRARSALGIGNGSPLMFDNLQFVEDFISLPTKGLFETIVTGYGTSSQTSRLAGRNDPETMKFTMLQAVKRGKDDLYIINNRHQTSSDAIQTQEIFYNKPGSIFGRSWYQLAPYFSNYSSIFDGQYSGDNVRVGDYHGGVRHSNNKQETMAIWFAPKPRADIIISADSQTKSVQKSALRSSYSSTTIQTVIRTNRIAYSERLDRTNFWSTTGATVSTSTALLSPLLPYRAVSYDADQLHELFYNQPRQPLYKKWYTIVPLSTRTQSWTSTAINIINVTSSNGQHGATTLINFSIGLDNYFSYGMFVKQRTGVNRVRLQVGLPADAFVDFMSGSGSYDLLETLILPFDVDLISLGAEYLIDRYADFDLSSGTVINRLNVSYANITDRGNGWKLIKIAGPINGTVNAATDTLPVFRDFVSIRDSLELSSALFDLAPADLLIQNGAVDLTDTGGIEELL